MLQATVTSSTIFINPHHYNYLACFSTIAAMKSSIPDLIGLKPAHNKDLCMYSNYAVTSQRTAFEKQAGMFRQSLHTAANISKTIKSSEFYSALLSSEQLSLLSFTTLCLALFIKTVKYTAN